MDHEKKLNLNSSCFLILLPWFFLSSRHPVKPSCGHTLHLSPVDLLVSCFVASGVCNHLVFTKVGAEGYTLKQAVQ